MRWLLLHSCIKRILEQLNALKLFFQGEYLLDKNTKEIFDGIHIQYNLCMHFELYLNCLDYVLPFLTSLKKNRRSIFCIQEWILPIKLF